MGRHLGDRLTVLYLTDLADIGGAERRLISFAEHLRPDRYRLLFGSLAGPGPLQAEMRARGWESFHLGVSSRWDYPAALARLVRLIRAAQPQIVHAQLPYACLLGGLAARLCRVPVVVATRAYNRAYVRDIFGFKHPWLDVISTRLMDATVAVSRSVHDSIIQYDRAKPDRIVVILNGVDLRRFRPPAPERRQALREELGLDGRPLIGAVGSPAAAKAYQYLIGAAPAILARHPQAQFFIVGDGPLRAKLEADCAARGLREKVRFLGYRADVPDLLALMDFYVHSAVAEGLSNALLEAMAAGRTIVATAIPSNVEIMTDGEDALLVPAADPDALAQALLRVIEDRELARRLAMAARRRVETLYTVERMIEQYEALYARLLERAAGGRAYCRSSGGK